MCAAHLMELGCGKGERKRIISKVRLRDKVKVRGKVKMGRIYEDWRCMKKMENDNL